MNERMPRSPAGDRPLRLLLMPRDRYPPSRIDVRILFGREIPALGHEVDWIVQSDAPLRGARVESYGGGRAWVGPAMGGANAVAKAIRFLQGLLHEVRVFRLARLGAYDVVQSKDEFVGALLALMAARLARARFVYWLSFPYPEDWLRGARAGEARYPCIDSLRGRLFGWLLYRVLLPAADLVLVQSEQMRLDIMEQGIPEQKLFAVPMGVEERILRKEAGAQAHDPTLVYLGTMVRVRRIEFVLDVFARVLHRMASTRLLMVGGTDEEVQRLRHYAERLGVAPRVVFTGQVPREQALRLVQAAHVCLSPFYPTPVLNSTSPTKLMEYFALARPVVANHHPEQTRVVEESGGGLCVPYQVDAFADAALELLGDPERARSMGRRARQYAWARSYSKIAPAVVERYHELLATGNSRLPSAS